MSFLWDSFSESVPLNYETDETDSPLPCVSRESPGSEPRVALPVLLPRSV